MLGNPPLLLADVLSANLMLLVYFHSYCEFISFPSGRGRLYSSVRGMMISVVVGFISGLLGV